MLPVASTDVIYRALGDGAVLFATTEEAYFGLNAVGAQVWELLPPVTTTLGELCEALRARYPEVHPETLRTDVEELLATLVRHGLVVPRAPAATTECATCMAPAIHAR
jgi:hypothetical protein